MASTRGGGYVYVTSSGETEVSADQMTHKIHIATDGLKTLPD